MVGMSVDFLSLIERGRNAPSFKKLELMIKGLGVSAAYLFTFEDPPRTARKRKITERSVIGFILCVGRPPRHRPRDRSVT